MSHLGISKKIGSLAFALASSAVLALPAGGPSGPVTSGQESAPIVLRVTADSEILSRIHKANLAEIEVSLLALQKASSTDVKNYAQMLLQDHQLGDQKLAQLAIDIKLTWASSACPNRSLQERESKELFGMRRLLDLSGAEFDRAFLTLMVEDHRSVIDELSAVQTNETRIKSLILNLLPDLRHHLEQAQSLLQSL